MRSKRSILTILLFFVSLAGTAYGQVMPAAAEGNSIFSVGAGATRWAEDDWGPGGRLTGITAWIDIHPTMPRMLNGLGLEIEGQDAHWNRVNTSPNFRLDSISGGPTYTLLRYQRFRPMAKFLIGQGSMDFTLQQGSQNYHHDTTIMYSPGGALQFRVYQGIWVRGDYEYQFWPRLWHTTPHGLTVGVMYDFRPFHRGY